MKANWVMYRDEYVAQAIDRFQAMRDGEWGLWSEEANRKRSERSKWIMKKAQAEIHAETDIDAKMSELQHRLRREMPYDGPLDGSDYLEYCRKLCHAITTHPEYRAIADPFMSAAIPRIAEEWNKRKLASRKETYQTATG